MDINSKSDKPIFMQIAEGIEDSILSGIFLEEDQIPSITEFSVRYTINPATALKGINLLVDEGIVYKKRGVGMFVAEGAYEKLKSKRQEVFFKEHILRLIEEAKRLGVKKDEIIKMIDLRFEE